MSQQAEQTTEDQSTEPSWQSVDRIVRKRQEGGSDWGVERFVLARQFLNGKLKELVWWRSHKSWSGRMEGYQHTPANLIMVSYNGRAAMPGWLMGSDCACKTLHEGGRLSRGLIAQHRDAIDAFFGEPVADQIEIKRTLLKTDKPG